MNLAPRLSTVNVGLNTVLHPSLSPIARRNASVLNTTRLDPSRTVIARTNPLGCSMSAINSVAEESFDDMIDESGPRISDAFAERSHYLIFADWHQLITIRLL